MTPERKSKLDEVLLSMAEQIATMSVATRSKVGAILYKDNNILSMGWNGMPSGFPNEDVEATNPDGSKTTNPLVLHAESNAILKCAATHGGAKGSTLYCTMSPCPDCTKLIIQAEIKRVVYRYDYRIPEGIPILEKAGIEVVKLAHPLEEAKPEPKYEPKYEIITCPVCGGRGSRTAFRGVFYAQTCRSCGGAGQLKRLVNE